MTTIPEFPVWLREEHLDEVLRILTEHAAELDARLDEGEAQDACDLIEIFEKAKARRLSPTASIQTELLAGTCGPLACRVSNALDRFVKKREAQAKDDVVRFLDHLPIPRTVGDLTQWSQAHLLTIPDFGRKSIEFLEALLEEAGYKLSEGYLQRKFREEKC